MSRLSELAAFVARAELDDLSAEAVEQLRIRLLDSIGCAIGALEAPPVRRVRAHVEEFGGAPRATLIGGGRSAPDRAALLNAAMVRYLDFNDSYLAPDETCHPSDNIAPILAAAEDADASGADLLTAIAVAYQIQCRLSDEAPVRDHGFDHTVHGQYAVAAGVARVLALESGAIANGIAISATAHNALRVTRTGQISAWKGLASAETAFTGLHSVYLARRGITGPPEVFEGDKGFMHSIAGDFVLDWRDEDLERVRSTILKKHNSEVHSQTAVEAILQLRRECGIAADEVEAIEVEIFDVAHRIIGGGEEGGKKRVETREQADHSLPYILAVALLDGQVLPAQYAPERICAEDVQSLLQRVSVSPNDEYSGRFPEAMPVCVRVRMSSGEVHEREQTDYEGFHTRPADWDTAEAKFDSLASSSADERLRGEIVDAVRELPGTPPRELARLLGRVSAGGD